MKILVEISNSLLIRKTILEEFSIQTLLMGMLILRNQREGKAEWEQYFSAKNTLEQEGYL